MNRDKEITGIILAGGKSSRMGRHKGLIRLDGVSFMEHIIAALKPFVKNIIIVSNHKEYDDFNLMRVDDHIEDAGPLAGLYSGLDHSSTVVNIVVGCDTPLLNSVLLNKLIEAEDEHSDIVQLKSNGKAMPLIALYKKVCQQQCLDLLENGERRLQSLASTMRNKTIELNPELDWFTRNINTPEQLKELRNEIEN